MEKLFLKIKFYMWWRYVIEENINSNQLITLEEKRLSEAIIVKKMNFNDVFENTIYYEYIIRLFLKSVKNIDILHFEEEIYDKKQEHPSTCIGLVS